MLVSNGEVSWALTTAQDPQRTVGTAASKRVRLGGEADFNQLNVVGLPTSVKGPPSIAAGKRPIGQTLGLCTPTKATNPVLNNEVNTEPVSDRGPIALRSGGMSGSSGCASEAGSRFAKQDRHQLKATRLLPRISGAHVALRRERDADARREPGLALVSASPKSTRTWRMFGRLGAEGARPGRRRQSLAAAQSDRVGIERHLEGGMMRARALLGSLIASALIALTPQAAQAAGSTGSWHPAPKGGLDCNGFSPVQTTYRQLWCTEIAANDENGFEDNGHYVGHDEPDIGFFSFQHGSANRMTYQTMLPVDPAPAVDGVRRVDARVRAHAGDLVRLDDVRQRELPRGQQGLHAGQRLQRPGPPAAQSCRRGVHGVADVSAGLCASDLV